MSYQEARNVRRESRTLVGRFRGGKLAPVMAVAVKGNEGGMLSQSITYELDPIAGRMITPITGEVISVFVPVQAIDAIKDPDAAYAGMTEVIREKLLSGNPLFGLENESEISKRCGVNPRSIGGVKRVNEMVRLAHNAAVNHLRQRKYVKASLLLHNSTAVTPALISHTVLERLNGVLDPDDRINGSVQLDIPDVSMPVLGGNGIVAMRDIGTQRGGRLRNRGSGNFEDHGQTGYKVLGTTGADGRIVSVQPSSNENQPLGQQQYFYDPNGSLMVDLSGMYAQFNGAAAGGVSLTDFYNAERMDRLTRDMRQIVDNNPEYGEEMVLRWAHGLSVDAGKVPFVIYERSSSFGRTIMPATDSAGVQDDVMRSDMMLQLGFNVPIPRTELGGIIITFACLKPDETLSSQPHPMLSDVWGADNFVADELALDPVPVTIRELDSECTAAQESTVSMYTGLNALKQTYVHYGLSRQLDPETVENKTAVWQLEIPMSVTPDNILYPADLEHYPFADQLAEVCTYTIASNVTMQTPMIFGPTPVEELAIIGDEDIFEQE